MKYKLPLLVFVFGLIIGLAVQEKHGILDFKPPHNENKAQKSIVSTNFSEAVIESEPVVDEFVKNSIAPFIVITSDLHLASETGRNFPKTNEAFELFLKNIASKKPDLIFVNGDIIDNVVWQNGAIVGGSQQNWQRETDIYHEMISPYSDITFLQSLGVGHDYGGTIKETSGLADKKGVYEWNGYQLIWFNINKAAFKNAAPDYGGSMSGEDYFWLNDQLEKSTNAILLFHVPLRTAETSSRGRWPRDFNLTIDYRDKIYEIIDKHQRKIKAIFNGHIHKQIESKYRGIPLYICPFVNDGGHCIVSKDDEGLKIRYMDKNDGYF